MFYDVDIQFKHETPIPAIFILNVLSELEERIKLMRLEQLSQLSDQSSSAAQQVIARIRDEIFPEYDQEVFTLTGVEQTINWFWVENTYAGSSNYKGKGGGFRTFFLSAMAILSVNTAEDMQIVSDLQKNIVESVDQEYENVKRVCEGGYQNYFVKCYKQEERIKIEITLDENLAEQYSIANQNIRNYFR